MLKHLSFLLTLLCLSSIGSRAATVSGTLTNLSLSAPASSQLVYLIDSPSVGVYRYIDSTYTNSSGAYSFTVSSSISTGLFKIMTYACNRQYFSPYSTYSGSNLTFNLSICAPITVNGTVSYLGAIAAAATKVYLVDTNYTLGITYRDSTITNSSGQYSFTVPTTINMYRMYANACSIRWNTAFNYTAWGNATVNLTLNCPWPTIRDTVKNSTTGLPVLGQKVYLVDSTATSYRLDSALSDRYGVVYFNMPPNAVSGTKRVFTDACGIQSQTFTYSGSNMVGPTLSICLSNVILSGTVTNATTSAVVPNQWLAIYDSTTTTQLYVDSARTNASGFYSVAVPMYVPSTGTMIVETYACGMRHTSRATYSGSNMTLNLSICASSSATITGVVSAYSNGAPLSGRKVYLVDTNFATGIVLSRDSTVTNSAGFYSFSVPPSVVTALYKIATPSCGNLNWQYLGYTGYSFVRNFIVCNTTGMSTVSGTLLNINGAPVAGANVSLNLISGVVSTTTNSSGAYTLTIPATLTLGTNMTWHAQNSCGFRNKTITHKGVNIVQTDTLPANWCNTISGTVSKQGGGAAASAKVYLICEFYDSTFTPAAIILRAMDSTITNASGQYSFFNVGFATLVQRIKAALQPSDPSYWNYLPTYHDSSLTWSGATTFGYSTWTANASNMNVSLRAGTNPGGPGFIGGNVLVGANKSTGVGDPLSQRILLLTTDNDVAVGYAFSDASGAFSFPNLPYGNYKLFGDAGGKTNPPLAITLSASAASVTNVVFEENDKKFEGHIGGVGVPTQKSDALRLYPNPAGAYITLNGLNSLAGNKTVVVRNVAGAMVYSVEAASGDVFTIPTEKLPAGIYILQLHTTSGVHNLRFVKN